jgi:seryl-tRNA synthetase
VDAFNSLISNKDDILRIHAEILEALTDTAGLDREHERLQSEHDTVFELMQKCVEENAHTALDQEEYQRRYNALLERYEAVTSGLVRIDDQRQERAAKHENVMRFLETLKQSDLLTEFDEALWNITVDTVTVHSEHDIAFMFRDGTALNWKT